MQTKTQTKDTGSTQKSSDRWNFDQSTIDASAREWQSYRLTTFNERVQLLLSKKLKAESAFEDVISTYATKDSDYEAPHLKVGLGVIRPVVLTVGDPFRCDVVAKLCDRAEEI